MNTSKLKSILRRRVTHAQGMKKLADKNGDSEASKFYQGNENIAQSKLDKLK